MSAPAFHDLSVNVAPETADAVALTFDVPDDLQEVFCYRPGQHLVLRAEIDGEDVRRSYSICSSVADKKLRVGVKRIPEGVFSTYASSVLSTGDVVQVMAPIGEFGHTPDPNNAKRYVALAAGSGITPILSIVSSILEVEQASTVTLVYGNKTTTSIMFLEDLEALKNRFCDRFQVIHILSREPHDIPLFSGRIDEDKIRLLASSLIEVSSVDDWFLCGPLDMVEEAQATLRSLGVKAEHVNVELFFDKRIEALPDADDDAVGMIPTTFTLDGRESSVAVDPNGPAILDYARTVRAEVPFACRGGMCATCKVKVVTGDVRLDKNYALTDAEVAEGFVLTCQAHPSEDSGPVHLSFDVHGGMGR